MISTIEEHELEGERGRLALLTRKGIGMPCAGLVYWIAVAVILRQMPARQGLIVAFFATGAVFPVGAMLTKLMGGDLFAKSRTLTPLGLQLAAVQLFYWPIIVVIFRQATEWTPFALAILFGSHFLPYWWLYRSRAYALLAGLTSVVCTVAVLVAGDPLFTTIPLLAVGCYAVACIALSLEVASLQRSTA